MSVDLKKPERPPSDMADKFMLRLPDGMRDRIAAEAQANNRSMNAEIVSRLDASLFVRDSESTDAASLLGEVKNLRIMLNYIQSSLMQERALKDVILRYMAESAHSTVNDKTSTEHLKVAHDLYQIMEKHRSEIENNPLAHAFDDYKSDDTKDHDEQRKG